MKQYPCKVVICDGHQMFRSRLTHVLTSDKKIMVIHQAGNIIQLNSVLQHSDPDVILFDLKLLISDRFQVVRKIKKMLPNASIVAMGLYEDDCTMEELRVKGIDHFLAKNAEPKEFYHLIHSCPQKNYGLTG